MWHAGVAPLITQIVKSLTFPVLSIPSEEITLNGSTYTLSVSQVNISAIQGPQEELLTKVRSPVPYRFGILERPRTVAGQASRDWSRWRLGQGVRWWDRLRGS